MDRFDYRTLKDTLAHRKGYDMIDTIISVGHILNREFIFDGASDAFDYIEKPWHWESDMRDLIVEYELDKVSKDLEYLTLDQAEEAILWLDLFCHFDYKTIQALLGTLEERYVLCGYAPCGVK